MNTPDIQHIQPLPKRVITWAEFDSGKVAIIGDNCELTYGDLAQRMTRVAGGLLAHGVTPSDRVVIAVSHKPDFVCSTLATMAVGAYAVPTAQYEEDLEGVIQNVTPRVIITDTADCARLQALYPASDCVTFDAIFQDIHAPLYDPAPEHVALFIHTSGTTSGRRRGAMLSHRSLCGTAQYMNTHMGVDREIRELIIPPLQHGFGMGRCRAILHAGGTMVLQDGIFSPASAITILDENKCNAFSSASSGVALLLDNYADDIAEFGDRIRWLEMGTLPLDKRYMEKLMAILPQARIFLTYGMTEAIRSTILEINKNKEKLDTVGQPAQGTDVRIVDETETTVDTGVTGKIQVTGVNLASGYWNAPQAWQEKLFHGWVESGDLGWFDEDGFLHFVGRQDDMINVGGLKVSPVEIEEALKPLLGSVPFSVARVPDPDKIQGYVPAVFVEGKCALDIETVRSSLRDHLAEFKIPRMIISIGELPRTTATRKVRRAELAKYAEGLLQRKEHSPLPVLISEKLRRQRRFWPVITGHRPLNYGGLARRIAKQNTPVSKREKDRDVLSDLSRVLSDFLQGNTLQVGPGLSPPYGNSGENHNPPLTDSVALQWIHDGHERLIHYSDIESATNWFTGSFPLNSESLVLLDTGDVDPELILAAEVAVITNGATLYIPDKKERMSAASLLGAVHRHRVTHLIIGNEFMESVMNAENYWNNSFLEPQLEWVIWAGPKLKRKVLLEFSARFGITPRHAYKTKNQWHAVIDKDLLSEIDEGVIWGTLKHLATEIFAVKGGLLNRDSNAGSISGWDSLAFVNLVVATEERFGIRMRPRDIMSITTLGDMERLIERRME
jgi:long-chain acyl-CoA synthetase